MPRFFFHLVSTDGYSVDDIGGEFPSVEAAYMDAWQAALEMGCEMLRERRDPWHQQFEIVDEHGRFLMEVPFSEVMRPKGLTGRPRIGSAELLQCVSRSRELRAEIKVELSAIKTVLETTRAALARSRAQTYLG
jgi:hypothetical protein